MAGKIEIGRMEKRMLEFIALLTAANQNRPVLILASQYRVDQLLAQLNGMKVKGSLYLQPDDGEFDGFCEAD